ncbi:MAG: alpha-amylase family glycosyl hydrolase [Pseudomonadota bacterium]
MHLPQRPILYEINTWVWLNELGRKRGAAITLGSVPDEEWDALAGLGMDAVWLMGVWERSPAGIGIASHNKGLMASFRQALPDFTTADNVGSPYCIRRYTVDPHLGGNGGLAKARERLAGRGIGLILDFVPNHVAPDHPWVSDHPEYFIQGSTADLATEPESFVEAGGTVFACGRDPYFPAWPDVLQLNAFAAGLRQAAADTLLDIAGQCDGVRCDMAMLLLNAVFERTWGPRTGSRPDADYWSAIIPAVKTRFPDFTFIAEAYWDLEWELQQQGFDFCYDKRLYDRLEKESADPVRLHLLADMAYQGKLLRFIENHDEPRAAAAFPQDRLRAVAVAALTLPGAKLLHEGQLEGRRIRLPVFLARRPSETPNEPLREFHLNLLKAICDDVFKTGEWHLCKCLGWPDNSSHRNLAAWCWRLGLDCRIVTVNLSDSPSQGLVRLLWEDMRDKDILLQDVFTDLHYSRPGNELKASGLFIDLPAWGYHLFKFCIN